MSRLQENDIVEIHSLKQTAEHNGQFGRIVEFVAARERFSVRLLGTNRLLNIKSANLKAADKDLLREKLSDLMFGLSKKQLVALIKEKNGTTPSTKLNEMNVEALSNLALELGCEYIHPEATDSLPAASSSARHRQAADPNVEEMCRQFEQMSNSELKKKLSQLKSASPAQLRMGNPGLRDMKDSEVRLAVQPEIEKLQKMLISPEASCVFCFCS